MFNSKIYTSAHPFMEPIKVDTYYYKLGWYNLDRPYFILEMNYVRSKINYRCNIGFVWINDQNVHWCSDYLTKLTNFIFMNHEKNVCELYVQITNPINKRVARVEFYSIDPTLNPMVPHTLLGWMNYKVSRGPRNRLP